MLVGCRRVSARENNWRTPVLALTSSELLYFQRFQATATSQEQKQIQEPPKTGTRRGFLTSMASAYLDLCVVSMTFCHYPASAHRFLI